MFKQICKNIAPLSSSSLNAVVNQQLIRTNFVISFTRRKPKPIPMAYTAFEATDAEHSTAPLIVVHGLFASKQQWKTMCQAIQEKTKPLRKVIAVDVRNHGESPHSPYHSYPHIAEDIVEFLKENSLDKAALLGHSMGGRAVMYTALKYPHLVDSIIIVDISPFATPRNFLQMETMFPIIKSIVIPPNLTFSEGRDNVARSLKSALNNPTLIDFLQSNLKKTESGRFIWGQNLDVLHTNFREITQFPFDEINGKQYRGRSLFIGAKKSDFLKQSDFEEIKKYFPKAELKYIDSGHYIHSEQPGDFAKTIVGFLNS